MTRGKTTVDFKVLVLFGLIALSHLSSATQISPAELRDPDIYAVCAWGSCFSPPYGRAFCFDNQIPPPRPDPYEPSAPHKTLLLRGRFISKTTHSAIFLMYETYPVSYGFFDLGCSYKNLEAPFSDFEELREVDPALRDIRRGDRVCVMPLATYKKSNSMPSTLRAV